MGDRGEEEEVGDLGTLSRGWLIFYPPLLLSAGGLCLLQGGYRGGSLWELSKACSSSSSMSSSSSPVLQVVLNTSSTLLGLAVDRRRPGLGARSG
jgi:hypothetical protein